MLQAATIDEYGQFSAGYDHFFKATIYCSKRTYFSNQINLNFLEFLIHSIEQISINKINDLIEARGGRGCSKLGVQIFFETLKYLCAKYEIYLIEAQTIGAQMKAYTRTLEATSKWVGKT